MSSTNTANSASASTSSTLLRSATEDKYTRPEMHLLQEDVDGFKFRLSGLNVSLANAIRRTILSDIPAYVLDGENNCTIKENPIRIHNEIVKHRLSQIPVNEKVVIPSNIDQPYENVFANYVMELDVKNETESVLYVYSSDFRIRNKETGKYVTQEERDRIFPKCELTNSYVVLTRLNPRVSENFPPNHIQLTCEFAIGTAAQSGAFAVASTCAYMNTISPEKANHAWEEIENKMRSDGSPAEEIEFAKRNFDLLDRQRYFDTDSFDFIVESVGVYESRELVKMACLVLRNQFMQLIRDIDARTVSITTSDVAMNYCYDFILEKGDYTIGKALEFYLYSKYFVEEGKLNYCGFKKFHPHDTSSVIRLAGKDKYFDETEVTNMMRTACLLAKAFYENVFAMF